jgi:hypothetical protein
VVCDAHAGGPDREQAGPGPQTRAGIAGAEEGAFDRPFSTVRSLPAARSLVPRRLATRVITRRLLVARSTIAGARRHVFRLGVGRVDVSHKRGRRKGGEQCNQNELSEGRERDIILLPDRQTPSPSPAIFTPPRRVAALSSRRACCAWRGTAARFARASAYGSWRSVTGAPHAGSHPSGRCRCR